MPVQDKQDIYYIEVMCIVNYAKQSLYDVVYTHELAHIGLCRTHAICGNFFDT